MSNLSVIFNYQGNKMTMQCQGQDVVDSVFDKFCQKAKIDINDVAFYYNSNVVKKSGKTLDALGVKNLFAFDVVREKYVSGAL